jgi:hypothetical protein
VTYTVKDLKDLLIGLPDDMKVIVSQDAEGNALKYLADHDVTHVIDDECAWEIETANLNDPAERAEWVDEGEELPDYPRALVLWPVN